MRYLLILVLFANLIYSQSYKGVDYVIEEGIKNKITPGASVAVGNSEEILYKNYYGRFTYDKSAPEVNEESMFDMASVTKVMATTLCVMKLYDEGRINLDDKVSKYIPEFAANGKDNITLRNLLLHNSGLPSYYSPGSLGREELFDKIFGLKKVYDTGTKMVYSCLNFITLMKVTEAVTGEMMYRFYAENFTEPLNLTHTMFNPPAEMKENCLPTEGGLQGIVHDPLARALEGYSGNAGLFSNVDDLALYCRMLLNKGEINGIRFFSEATVDTFITRGDVKSSRALGWDTNLEYAKSCGPMFSESTFGHTGYTGPCVWMDPEKDLFVVFLNNRVYPDDKASVSNLRISVHNQVIKSIENIPPDPAIKSMLREKEKSVKIKAETGVEKGNIEKCSLFLNGKVIKTWSSVPEVIEHVVMLNEKSNEIWFQNENGENKSLPSDKYIVNGTGNDLLIIDGIDRDASEESPYYDSFQKIAESIGDAHDIYVCNHEDIISGKINPLDYKLTYWATGEDNNGDDILNGEERKLIKKFINEGAKIIFAGTEVGWVFGQLKSDDELLDFYKNFLGAEFMGDKAESDKIVYVKEGKEFPFGTSKALYHAYYPDFFQNRPDSKVLFRYGDNSGAGIIKHFENNCSLVYLGFPLEIIEGEDNIREVFNILIKETGTAF